MTERTAKLKMRLAKLEESLNKLDDENAEPKEVLADGASMTASEGIKSLKASLDRAIERRASRKLRTAGAEDKITQEYLGDVEKCVGRKPDGVKNSIRDVRTKLVNASESLDKIANELEKQGKIALAYRVDRVADEIDARLEKIAAEPMVSEESKTGYDEWFKNIEKEYKDYQSDPGKWLSEHKGKLPPPPPEIEVI